MGNRKELILEWLSNNDKYLNEFGQTIVFLPGGEQLNLNVLI